MAKQRLRKGEFSDLFIQYIKEADIGGSAWADDELDNETQLRISGEGFIPGAKPVDLGEGNGIQLPPGRKRVRSKES